MMSWLTKSFLALLRFSLTRLFPGSSFVIWVFDQQKEVRASVFLKVRKDGSYSHKIIEKRNTNHRAGQAK
jgi:hypothetical protein